MISHPIIQIPMIQFGEIAEVLFRLFSHLDCSQSCLVKSPNGLVKLEYFPDCSCLCMALRGERRAPARQPPRQRCSRSRRVGTKIPQTSLHRSSIPPAQAAPAPAAGPRRRPRRRRAKEPAGATVAKKSCCA